LGSHLRQAKGILSLAAEISEYRSKVKDHLLLISQLYCIRFGHRDPLELLGRIPANGVKYMDLSYEHEYFFREKFAGL
jgi:hypothetical protein